MCERVVVELAAGDDDASLERLVDRVERIVFVDLRDRGRDGEREHDLEQRAGGQELVGIRGEAGEATADHVADAGRDAEVTRRGHPHAVDLAQPTLVDEVQERLAEKERVAVGLDREQRGELRRDVVAGEALEQCEDVVGVESVERDAGRLDLALEQWERGGERMPAVEVGLPVRPDDDDRRVRGDAAERPQHADRRLVGPVQIVDDEHHRGLGREPGAAPGRRRRAGSGLGLGWDRQRLTDLGQRPCGSWVPAGRPPPRRCRASRAPPRPGCGGPSR